MTITRHLVPSPKTVRHHVSDVFAKIQAADRPGAIVLAHRYGLGSCPGPSDRRRWSTSPSTTARTVPTSARRQLGPRGGET